MRKLLCGPGRPMLARFRLSYQDVSIGQKTAALIAKRLGAADVDRGGWGFGLNGERVAIEVLQSGFGRIIVPCTTLDRVNAVIAALEIGPREYGLLLLSRDLYRRFMRGASCGGRPVGVVTRRMLLRWGQFLGRIELGSSRTVEPA